MNLGILEWLQTRGPQFWTQPKMEMENLPEPDTHFIFIFSQTQLD